MFAKYGTFSLDSYTEKTVKKAQRQRHSSWAFYQLRQFIQYKAELHSVTVVAVNPHNTSRRCPVCGYTDKANRVSRDDFVCQSCGYAAPADYTAALNIESRAVVVNQPNVGA